MKIRAATVRFDYLNKTFLYDAGDVEAEPGRLVIVETDHGLDRGVLDDEISEEDVDKEELPLRKIIRAATDEDAEKIKAMAPKEENAYQICEEEIQKAGLKMKLINSRFSFEGTKVSFCYTADGRVDFRELVRTLASRLKARVELRQVGVRDEARLIGGLGVCGRPLCCASFLREFQPVSIRMAKDQGLPLNPLKISGACGRLFCCLKYEHDFYCQARKRVPQVGDTVELEGKNARVAALNILKESALLELGEGEKREVAFGVLEQCRCRHRAPREDEDMEDEDRAGATGKEPGEGSE